MTLTVTAESWFITESARVRLSPYCPTGLHSVPAGRPRALRVGLERYSQAIQNNGAELL